MVRRKVGGRHFPEEKKEPTPLAPEAENRSCGPVCVVLLEKFRRKRLGDWMKIIFLSALSLFLGLSLVCANPLAKKPGTKITKNEAEHIALRQHKGARVTAAKLETVEDKKIWVIEIAQGKRQTKVQVDAVRGRVVASEKIDR